MAKSVECLSMAGWYSILRATSVYSQAAADSPASSAAPHLMRSQRASVVRPAFGFQTTRKPMQASIFPPDWVAILEETSETAVLCCGGCHVEFSYRYLLRRIENSVLKSFRNKNQHFGRVRCAVQLIFAVWTDERTSSMAFCVVRYMSSLAWFDQVHNVKIAFAVSLFQRNA